jgi:hypothetical protein
MRTRIWTGLVLLAVMVLGFTFGPSLTPAQDKAPARGKWEYKIVKIPATSGGITVGNVTRIGIAPGTISEGKLTDLGEQGWDLIKVTDGQPLHKMDGYSNTVYYFKRPK